MTQSATVSHGQVPLPKSDVRAAASTSEVRQLAGGVTVESHGSGVQSFLVLYHLYVTL